MESISSCNDECNHQLTDGIAYLDSNHQLTVSLAYLESIHQLTDHSGSDHIFSANALD